MSERQTRYQHRISKLVWAANIYGVLGAFGIWYSSLPALAWLVLASTITVLYAVAAGFDAVFDSLNERINIQSAWLDARLSVLEKATGASSGQAKWAEHGVPTDDSEHYFHVYPERKDT